MKKAVIFGAGNIGRGFIGQLFSQSGYQVTFIEIDSDLLAELNEKHQYTIEVVSPEERKEIIIKNVKGIHPRNIEEISSEISRADIMATAVGVNALSKIVGNLTYGFKERWDKGNFSPLNIILCENLLDADCYLKKLIIENIKNKNYSQQMIDNFRTKVGLVKASIGRMVPRMPEELRRQNPLKIRVEPYSELPVDKEGFIGDIPEIKNLRPYSPFDFFIKRKLFMHNMAHAVCAYLGYLIDYKFIWQSVADVDICIITKNALEESLTALANEYNKPKKELQNFADELIYRFGNKALGDTVIRVGRDPLRKLSADDRLAGAARYCREQDVFPNNICRGLAAGLLFSPQEDESAVELQKLVKNRGIEGVLREISSIEDKELITAINRYYSILKETDDIAEVLA